ncbi:von Willebrand factor A domain-containing protein 3A-like isoform X3 [Mytilus californianus]|uniref:von Willebrand factor A domain-containing protein 3A-like isoform X3 n=1 Tax=Mytilus californianus TaxID=6549 RepID=UPI00224753B8|nr:von Willebrand factor A domain-containing protein 3A-like isoform X3 [Mytilus californianus]
MDNIFGNSGIGGYGQRRIYPLQEDSGEENYKEKGEKEVLTDEEAPGEEEFEVSELDEDEEDDDDEINELLKDIPDEKVIDWVNPTTKNVKPPHPLAITNVNQTRDLMRLQHAEAALQADLQTSEEWLKSHSIEYMKLTLKDLVDKGKVSGLKPDHKTGKAVQHIQFDAYDVNEFEYKLNVAIEQFTKRIKWNLQGSRRIFGNLRAKRLAVVVDMSDANAGFGRLQTLQENLVHLLDEQLSKATSVYLMSFGTDVDPLWPVSRDVNIRIIEEGKEWVLRLRQSGGCNLLKSMKHVMKLKDIDSVLLILGSVPDQTTEVLCDYIHQMGVGQHIELNCVAYDCSNQLTNLTLRNLAEASGGSYHCYTASCEEQIYTGTEISVILKEIQKAQDVINKIKEMRQGMMGSALVSIINEISTEVSKLPQSRFLPRPPGHDFQLKIEVPKFLARCSIEWIKQHGLKARKLDLYQVLAPNAYSYKEEFIPVIKKAVQSQVHEKAMVQFQWHDGSVKNVHVDMTQLFEYQKQLNSGVGLYEKRIDWLATGSRRIFGTVVDKNVVILIDMSVSNVNYLVHIQHSIRLLMEQQMANKKFFNIIAFGSKAVTWKPTMMKPTEQNLQAAWRWILDLQCGGSRNFLSAFKLAVENEEEIKHKIIPEGIYLFTSGVPDQSQDMCTSYIEQATSGRGIKLHCILFNVDDYDANGAIPGRYANITRTGECLRNMAHCSGGRFHWFRETGIIESDDIQYITTEIDKAMNFSRKVQILIDSVKKKYRNRYNHPYLDEIKALPAPESFKLRAIMSGGSPNYSHTARSEKQETAESEAKRSLHLRRPMSAPRIRDQTRSEAFRERPKSATKDPMKHVKSKKIMTGSFFLDNKQPGGDGTGSVYKKYPGNKSVRKNINHTIIPDIEDVVTTKEWMRLYSLSRLKLDLNKLISGPDCKHTEDNVKALHKQVSAKYCEIFPSINVKGTIKHLQLLPHELKEYESQTEKVLKRYLKRLQWLLSGSRRVFGNIVHTKCMILVDTSGSMDPYMTELKQELASLVWDQLYRLGARFNVVRFSGNCENWFDRLQPATQENCHDAVNWSSKFKASGNTCTLEALKMAFDDPEIEAIYMLTDGKPDTSTSLILREVGEGNNERNIQINTISFNCSDSTANNFLKLLATQTGGRFHMCHSDFDAQLFAHKLLTEGFGDTEYPHLPEFEGDDLRRLGQEIALARKYLAQARQYRSLYQSKVSTSEKPASNKGNAPPFIVGKPRASAR